MLKKNIWILVPALTLLLVLTAPCPSQAAVAAHSHFLADTPLSLLDKLAQWLDFLPGDGRTPRARALRTPRAPQAAPAQPTILQKHGCGIDPQGQPYCTPD